MDKRYKNRISMFDMVKGVAMLLFILIRSVGSASYFADSWLEWGWRLISYPGAAALFLVMGYWYIQKPPAQLFREMCRSALRLYGITMAAALAASLVFYWASFGRLFDAFSMLPYTALQFLLGYSYSIGGLWYVFAYFVSIQILNLLMNCKFFQKNPAVLQAVLIFCAALGFALDSMGDLPFCLPEVLMATGVFYVGHRLRQSGFLIKKWGVKEYLLLLLGAAAQAALYYTLAKMELFLVFNHCATTLSVFAGILLLRLCLYLQSLGLRSVGWICTVGSMTPLLLAILTVEDTAINWWLVADRLGLAESPLLGTLLILVMQAAFYGAAVLLVRSLGKRLRKRKPV